MGVTIPYNKSKFKPIELKLSVKLQMMFLFIFNHQEYLNIKNRIKAIETANKTEFKLKAPAPKGSEPINKIVDKIKDLINDVESGKLYLSTPNSKKEKLYKNKVNELLRLKNSYINKITDEPDIIVPDAIKFTPLANERLKERFAIERGYEIIKIETESAEIITTIGKHYENRK